MCGLVKLDKFHCICEAVFEQIFCRNISTSSVWLISEYLFIMSRIPHIRSMFTFEFVSLTFSVTTGSLLNRRKIAACTNDRIDEKMMQCSSIVTHISSFCVRSARIFRSLCLLLPRVQQPYISQYGISHITHHTSYIHRVGTHSAQRVAQYTMHTNGLSHLQCVLLYPLHLHHNS